MELEAKGKSLFLTVCGTTSSVPPLPKALDLQDRAVEPVKRKGVQSETQRKDRSRRTLKQPEGRSSLGIRRRGKHRGGKGPGLGGVGSFSRELTSAFLVARVALPYGRPAGPVNWGNGPECPGGERGPPKASPGRK